MSARPAAVEPSACQHCGIPRRRHAIQWVSVAGLHAWVAPTNAQILARMRERRATRTPKES